MRRRIPVALLLAALLLGLAALLLTLSEGPRPARARAEVAFPRWLRQPEAERAHARRTLPPLPAPAAGPAEEEPPERRDPFLVALPRDARKPLVVLEANALRHSRLGELFVQCALREPGRDPFEEARRETGIDPLKDIDRVAVSGDGMILYGFFDRARLDALGSARVTPRGEHGRVHEPRREAEQRGERALTFGTWRDELIVFGTSAFVEETLDRLEGGTRDEPLLIPEHLTYGEAYGVVPGEVLFPLFQGEYAELGRRLGETASRIELHADAMRDLALVARVSGANEQALADLGTAIGAALAVGRIQAMAQGNERMGELLEHARVVRAHDGGFSLELALPVEVVERWFEGCGPPR